VKKEIIITLFLLVISSVSFSQNILAYDNSISINKYLKFYPNPASAAINFDCQTANTNHLSLLIFNFMGKKVYELKNIPAKINIDLEQFYRGIYIYQLRHKNGTLLDIGKFQVLK